MDKFKLTVEILSSIASFIAIATVLISWFRNSQQALKIERVVIHNKPDKSTYILVVKNRKPYPVDIKSIKSYTKSYISVEKFKNQPPEYRSGFSLSDSVFNSNEVFEIAANGHSDIRIQGLTMSKELQSLLCYAQTSHGYQKLNCNNILNVQIDDQGQTYQVEYKKDFDSKLKAQLKFYWLKFKYVFIKS